MNKQLTNLRFQNHFKMKNFDFSEIVIENDDKVLTNSCLGLIIDNTHRRMRR